MDTNYISPSVTVVELNLQTQILAASSYGEEGAAGATMSIDGEDIYSF